MREDQVTFRSCGLTLEGLLASGDGDAPAAVVCHPHPRYGGSMFNNVVDAILGAMWQAGYATLRFNFRGVGASEGEHDGDRGAFDDAAAAMAFVLSQPGVRKDAAVMAGYSFGAMVAASAGYEHAEISRIVAVALPIGMTEARVPAGASKPLILVSGDRDSYSPVARLTTLQARIGKSARLEIIEGADHFFGGCEAELSRVIATAIRI
jgi:alpha/beta superfamily hydrolase